MNDSAEVLMKKIEERISFLLKTKNPKKEFQTMCELQKEHGPHLTKSEAEDYVIEGLVKVYNDRELDHLWYQFKNTRATPQTQAA